MSIVFVGYQGSPGKDPLCYTTMSGQTLATLLGMTKKEYDQTKRVNLLLDTDPGRPSTKLLKQRAAEFWDEVDADVVVVLGSRAGACILGDDERPSYLDMVHYRDSEVLVIPHPSPRSAAWNNGDVRTAIQDTLRRLWAERG